MSLPSSRRAGVIRTQLRLSRTVRRYTSWSPLLLLGFALLSPALTHAQFQPVRWSTAPIGTVPIVLAEHGDATLLVPFGAGVAGLALFDIFSAGESASRYNEREGAALKSPATATIVSVVGTAAPIGLGALLLNTGYDGTGALLVASGVLLGPSAGHWYAGRPGRGAVTAALRAGIIVLGGFVALQGLE